MTKNILICNQKGGVGKSTLADLLMWSFEKDGIPASFYDLDGQGGVIHQPIEVDNAAVAVIDTPGALQKDLGTWIQNADVIIIPTKAKILKIPQSELVVQAAAVGKSVIDYAPRSSAAEAASEFVHYIRSIIQI